MAKKNSSRCPKCNETYEKCGDKQVCSSWRTSYDVCIIFGTRPFRIGFTGAATSRR